jgi:hypothetical protein
MFKKLFSSLLGNDQEATPTNQESQNQHAQTASPNTGNSVFAPAGENGGGSYDPETHHGTHYSQAQFDAEVERRLNNWLADEDEQISDADIRNLRINIGADVFSDWNPNADERQRMKFQHVYSSAALGYTTFENAKQDDNNPLLQPIHGISLFDYGAASAKMANGISEEAICSALGVELPVWQEAGTLWIKRMQEDSTFSVTNLFGKYFGESDTHPRLNNLAAAPLNAAAQANLDKLGTDRYFYEELCGARQAAYAYGHDGAQWILDQFGISLGDFQSVAMKWMMEQNNQMDPQKMLHYSNYQQAKQQEYAERFAKEQGGNVADTIQF